MHSAYSLVSMIGKSLQTLDRGTIFPPLDIGEDEDQEEEGRIDQPSQGPCLPNQGQLKIDI